MLHMAKSKGVKFAISTDAHSVRLSLCVSALIRPACLDRPGDVLNVRPLAQLHSSLGRRDHVAA